MEWFRSGCKSASHWITRQLQIQPSTAREWIRVGHSLRYLPLIDAAFAAQGISYAKVRILTGWADGDNEKRLLEAAHERSASRLTTAIARMLAGDGETDEERDMRLHEDRAFTTWTDGDGMTIIRVALAPSVAKPVVAAVDELAGLHRPRQSLSKTSVADASDQQSVVGELTDCGRDPSAGAFDRQSVVGELTDCGRDPSAGASGERTVSERPPVAAPNDSTMGPR